MCFVSHLVFISAVDPSRIIRGILLQARREGSGFLNDVTTIVGTWSLFDGELERFKLVRCFQPDDTVTHQFRGTSSEASFLWRAPPDLTGGIQFL